MLPSLHTLAPLATANTRTLALPNVYLAPHAGSGGILAKTQVVSLTAFDSSVAHNTPQISLNEFLRPRLQPG